MFGFETFVVDGVGRFVTVCICTLCGVHDSNAWAAWCRLCGGQMAEHAVTPGELLRILSRWN